MEQNIEIYEFIIDKIIKNHKNSLQEILSVLRSLNILDDEILLRLISYLKMYTLYEITCENEDFKYYMLNLGESYFIFTETSHCTCNSEKLKLNNICIHFLIFRILFNINCYSKIQIDKHKMVEFLKIQKEEII